MGSGFFAALGPSPTEHAYLRAIQYVIVLDVSLLAACIAASLLLPRPRSARSTAPGPSSRVEPTDGAEAR